MCSCRKGTGYRIMAMHTMATLDKEACEKLKDMDTYQFTYN